MNLDLREPAAVPVAAPIARAPLVLADDHLLAEHVSGDLGGHLSALQLVAELGVAKVLK